MSRGFTEWLGGQMSTGQSGPMTTAIQLVGMLTALLLAAGTLIMIVGLVTARDGRETANGFE